MKTNLDSHHRLSHLQLISSPTKSLQLAVEDARRVSDPNLRSDDPGVFHGTVVQLGRQTPTRVYLDTGSIGNYISADFVSKTQLEVIRDSDEDQPIAVVNGNYLPIRGHVYFTLKLQGFMTRVRARVLPLEGHDVILGDDTLQPSFLSNTQPSPPTLRGFGTWADTVFDSTELREALGELSNLELQPKTSTTPQARLEENHVASYTDVLDEWQTLLAPSTPSSSEPNSGRVSTNRLQVAAHVLPDDGASSGGGATLAPIADSLSTEKDVALQSGSQSSTPDTESTSGMIVDQGQYFLVFNRHTERLSDLPRRNVTGQEITSLTQPSTSSTKRCPDSGSRPLLADQQRLALLLVKIMMFCYLGAKATHGQLWRALAQQTSGRSARGSTDRSRTNELASSNKRPRCHQEITAIRGLHDEDGQERDNDDPGDGRNIPETIDKREPHLQNQKSWACPYNKADPINFSSRNSQRRGYQLCSVVKLSSIATLKQHLKRVHQRP